MTTFPATEKKNYDKACVKLVKSIIDFHYKEFSILVRPEPIFSN